MKGEWPGLAPDPQYITSGSMGDLQPQLLIHDRMQGQEGMGATSQRGVRVREGWQLRQESTAVPHSSKQVALCLSESTQGK